MSESANASRTTKKRVLAYLKKLKRAGYKTKATLAPPPSAAKRKAKRDMQVASRRRNRI